MIICFISKPHNLSLNFWFARRLYVNRVKMKFLFPVNFQTSIFLFKTNFCNTYVHFLGKTFCYAPLHLWWTTLQTIDMYKYIVHICYLYMHWELKCRQEFISICSIHSSEIRGLCLVKSSSETLQKFWNMKIQI